jgi:hypothetical protein
MNFTNALPHSPFVLLLTLEVFGLFIGAILIMVGVLILLNDLVEGIRRLRRRS